MALIPDLRANQIPGYLLSGLEYHPGSYGRVFGCSKNNQTQLFVAKKCLKSSNEASKYDGFSHPNIVLPIETFYSDEYQIIIFERWDDNLYFFERNQVSIQQIDKIFETLASVLQYISKKGYQHRDIKMSNVFIKFKPFKIGLGDFSLCQKVQNQLEKRYDITQLGLLMWRLFKRQPLTQSIYKLSLYDISSKALTAGPPTGFKYGQIVWYILCRCTPSNYCTYDQIQEQISKKVFKTKKLKKANKSRKIQIKMRKQCHYCKKMYQASNFKRHVKRCQK